MDTQKKLHDAIEELKALTLVRDQDFSIPVTYFFDHLVDTGLLQKYNKPLKEDQKPFYEALFQPLLQRYQAKINIKFLLLQDIPGENFVHGFAVLSNAKSINLYFFPDINMGIATIVKTGDQVDYFRVSAFTSEGKTGAAVSMVPTEANKNVY